MTEFTVTAPPGLAIEHAHPVDGLDRSVEGATATWTGGSLAARSDGDVRGDPEGGREPGLVELRTRAALRRRRRRHVARALTVMPAAESPSQNLALAGVVGLIGVLVVVAIAMLAWRRRPPPYVMPACQSRSHDRHNAPVGARARRATRRPARR